MSKKKLSVLLEICAIGFAIIGVLFYTVIIPNLAEYMCRTYPEFAYCKYPWLIFVWATAAPCYGVLVCMWRVAANIGRDRIFVPLNSRLFKAISRLALGDSVFFFAGNILLWLLGMNHPGIIILSLLPVFAGFAVAICAAGLSQLTGQAAEMKEENDLTI